MIIALNGYLDTIQTIDYELREAYNYTMILPIEFYGMGFVYFYVYVIFFSLFFHRSFDQISKLPKFVEVKVMDLSLVLDFLLVTAIYLSLVNIWGH